MQHKSKRTIMVADDDLSILECVKLMLEFEGYTVQTTPMGNSLLTLQELPDLILLDIWMSGVDGREICKLLKADPKTSHIPVLLFSASTKLCLSASEAGADDYLEKPFEMDDLLRKIAKLLTPTSLNLQASCA